jgi:predicted dehydrogenase
MTEIKRYVLVGTGGRAAFHYMAIVRDFQKTAKLVAFCDLVQTRMDVANRRISEFAEPIKTYKAADFDKMIEEQRPHYVIVTTVDRTHHQYIIRALELGCDAIVEKPITVDEVKMQEIVDTVKRTGRQVRVTYNYRYAPHNTKVRELIVSGAIGEVTSVHFEWLLNTEHGADFFRRWHRLKTNSGGLFLSTSTHHVDLVNFWLGSDPQTVFALGNLRYYGRENAEARGEPRNYYRAVGSPAAVGDPFALHIDQIPQLKELYLDAEKEDAYIRDQNCFGDGITIEDTMGLMVHYKNKALLTYNQYAYAPWEGFRVNLNGTAGRIEMHIVEDSYVNGGAEAVKEGSLVSKSLRVYPLFGKAYDVEVDDAQGGHGGGDPIILRDIYGDAAHDPLNRAAYLHDGVMSTLVGIAGNNAIRMGKVVQIKDLVKF